MSFVVITWTQQKFFDTATEFSKGENTIKALIIALLIFSCAHIINQITNGVSNFLPIVQMPIIRGILEKTKIKLVSTGVIFQKKGNIYLIIPHTPIFFPLFFFITDSPRTNFSDLRTFFNISLEFPLNLYENPILQLCHLLLQQFCLPSLPLLAYASHKL